MLPEHKDVTSFCPAVSAILSRIGDKWSVMVVMQLGEGPKRFSVIKRAIGGISQRMLTLTLRGLERDGLISRRVYSAVPAKVEYSLTDLGSSLLSPVEALGAWAMSHRQEIADARTRFDRVAIEREQQA